MSRHTRFHLAYFTKFGAPAWRASDDRGHGRGWQSGDYFVELARQLESACFDFLFFEDGSAVSTVGGTMEIDLRNSMYAPQHDPLPLLPVIARGTEHIGVIATASTSLYPPYLLARELSTIDSLSGGRVGWNIVTSTARGNYGESGFPVERRYDVADEFLQVATRLWNSWDEGALVHDTESGVHVDFTKVHPIDYEGEFFSSRGPLNTLPSPQRAPVLAQAGLSEAGRAFSAKYAEVVVATTAGGVDGMRAVREDVRTRVARAGRNPDDCKIFFLANLAFTKGPTKSIVDAITDEQVLVMRAAFGSIVGADLSGYDLDEPFPVGLGASGHTGILQSMEALGREGKTLRQALLAYNFGEGELDLFGTPENIADKMAAAMDAVSGDGFLIHATSVANADYVRKLTHGVVPRLQAIDAMRTSYHGETLRDTLREF